MWRPIGMGASKRTLWGSLTGPPRAAIRRRSVASAGRADRTQSFSGPSVWSTFTPLALEYNATNLGQGFPDFRAPEFILDAARQAIEQNVNQYTRSQGHPRLVNALANEYSPLLGRELDPMSEVLVTVGATEALYLAMSAFVNPQDEVLLLEPFYDSYPADVILAGGTPKYVPLRCVDGDAPTHANDFVLDMDELEACVTEKTKLMVLNNPMNVIGKVFSKEELEAIAHFVRRHNLILVCDEVYERMVYDEHEHVRIASLPDMHERTITIGSAGKTFSVTGWKVGWALGPRELLDAMNSVHQSLCFCHGTPLQEAVAVAFEQAKERGYWDELQRMYASKRDATLHGLHKAGFATVRPVGSYFVLANTSHIPVERYVDESSDESLDVQLCKWMIRNWGVASIPPSPFYSPQHAHMAREYARFTFCKRDEIIAEGMSRLSLSSATDQEGAE